MKSDKSFVVNTILLVIGLLVIMGGITVYIDPFFHYHGPLEQFAYHISEERYQNDGIARHFQYDAIITGTSQTDNFKTSEADLLFQAHFIKIPFSGAFYKEVNDALIRAIDANPDIRLVIRSLDAAYLPMDKDREVYETYPTYLYDDKLINDGSYFWNKDVLFNYSLATLAYTNNGGQTTTFDEYSNWNSFSVFGKEAVDNLYQRPEKRETIQKWGEGDAEAVEGNVQQNVLALAEANPDITFYLFIPPYNIYNWDEWNQQGTLSYHLASQRRMIEMLVPCENIKLFSFFDHFDLVCDLSRYKDTVHYSEDVNSQILQWMAEGRYQLTEENYLDYCEKVESFYTSYDYDALFSEKTDG